MSVHSMYSLMFRILPYRRIDYEINSKTNKLISKLVQYHVNNDRKSRESRNLNSMDLLFSTAIDNTKYNYEHESNSLILNDFTNKINQMIKNKQEFLTQKNLITEFSQTLGFFS